MGGCRPGQDLRTGGPATILSMHTSPVRAGRLNKVLDEAQCQATWVSFSRASAFFGRAYQGSLPRGGEGAQLFPSVLSRRVPRSFRPERKATCALWVQRPKASLGLGGLDATGVATLHYNVRASPGRMIETMAGPEPLYRPRCVSWSARALGFPSSTVLTSSTRRPCGHERGQPSWTRLASTQSCV